MNPLLYLLTEDDRDDLFFEACLETITGWDFELRLPNRLRKGGGVSSLRKALPAFCNDLKHSGELEAYFIIAIDNDRAPDSTRNGWRPTGLSKRDQSKGCRYSEITKLLDRHLGRDRKKWPAQGSIAVPVQMLESWVILSLDPTAEDEQLPIFPEQSKRAAKNFYNGNAPPQLKDIVREFRTQSGLGRDELLMQVAADMDAANLATRSTSFAQFYDQVTDWNSDGF